MFNQDFSMQGQGRALSGDLANAFLRKVFTIMGLGLAITGLTAFLFSNWVESSPSLQATLRGPLQWVIIFAPLVMVFVISGGINRFSYATSTILFNIYAVLMGLSLSFVFLVYTSTSIATTFFVTAGMFIAMAVIGLTTKIDLSKLGSILIMAVIGIIIASVVNMFLGNPFLYWIISFAGVVIFAGLTAYDTQKLLHIGGQVDASSEVGGKWAIMGALSLYLDFINLFLFLLRFLGNRE